MKRLCLACRIAVAIKYGRCGILGKWWLRATLSAYAIPRGIEYVHAGIEWLALYKFHCGSVRDAGFYPTRERAEHMARVRALRLIGYRVNPQPLINDSDYDTEGWLVT